MRRSQRLPRAPPIIKASATVAALKVVRRIQSSRATTTRAATEMATSNTVLTGEGDSANKLKAAPGFSRCVRRKKPGIIWTASSSMMLRTTSSLVMRSRRKAARAIRRWRMLWVDSLFFLRSKENLAEQQQCADYDCAVGNIEGRPGGGADVEIQEVDHPPADHAVPQIAQRSAKDQRERNRGGVQGLAVL